MGSSAWLRPLCDVCVRVCLPYVCRAHQMCPNACFLAHAGRVCTTVCARASRATRSAHARSAAFDEKVHCVAAEPHATFLRIGITDGRQGEVAYETAVLGRLRRGYRVLQLRSVLGTRIELCYLFIKIRFGSDPNLWATPRQLRIQSSITKAAIAQRERHAPAKTDRTCATHRHMRTHPSFSRRTVSDIRPACWSGRWMPITA